MKFTVKSTDSHDSKQPAAVFAKVVSNNSDTEMYVQYFILQDISPYCNGEQQS